MKNKFLIALLLFYGFCCQAISAPKTQWETIAELSDVWAQGHYLSPGIACNSENWDVAFGDAVNKIITSNISLREAELLLSQSSDSYFFGMPDKQYIMGLPILSDKRNDLFSTSKYAVARINQALTSQEASIWRGFATKDILVLDLRSSQGNGIKDLVARSSIFENPYMLDVLGDSFGDLPPLETISYYGFPSEGVFSSGYFHSSILESSADQEREISKLPNSKSKKTIIVIGNQFTLLPRSLLASRISKNAFFISTEKSFSYGGLASSRSDPELNEPTLLFARFKGVDLKKALSPDGMISDACASDNECLARYLNAFNFSKSLNFTNDLNCERIPSNKEMLSSAETYPSQVSRVYAIVKAYQVLFLFHPLPELLGSDFRNRFVKAISAAANAKDESEYTRSLAGLIAFTRDEHIEILSMSYFKSIGLGDLPINIFVDKKEIYVGCEHERVPGLRVGDKIKSIDGKDVVTKISAIRNIDINNVDEYQYLKGSRFIFRGELGSQININYIDASGVERSAVFSRDSLRYGKCKLAWMPKSEVAIEWLKPDVAYINLSATTPDLVESKIKELNKARYLVIDDRGASTAAAWILAAHLSSESKITTAKFITPIILGKQFDASQYFDVRSFSIKNQWISGNLKPLLTAKVLILIDEHTMSQAEHSVLLLKAAANDNVITIGKKTAGALGDATRMVLPGGVALQFTGQTVEDKAGSKIFGIGINPDINVSETLDDLKKSKDPILEAALKITEK